MSASAPKLNLSPMSGSVDSTVTAAPGAGTAMNNAVKSTTGISDFQSAGKSFSKGNVLAGIGHAALGAVNAASTAAMAVPGIGEGIKGLDIGLNAAIKGADMFKAADATAAAEKASTASRVASDAGHLNTSQFHGPELPTLLHGSGANLRTGQVITPKPWVHGGETTLDSQHAWATTSERVASGHAQDAAQMGSHKTSAWEQGNPMKATQPSLFSPVYKVSPIDRAEMSSAGKNYVASKGPDQNVLEGSTFVSKKGFKVEGVHSWATNPDAIPKPTIKPPTGPRESGI